VLPTPEEPHEPFEPPGQTDLASLTDGRIPGDFKSTYPAVAWVQIILELLYLLAVLALSAFALVLIGDYSLNARSSGAVFDLVGEPQRGTPLVTWAAVGFAGACGGCASSLKWLYHGVAKMRWHRDRLIWRIVVPIISAVLAVFAGLMIVSGIVPFLNRVPFESPETGAAFGFFVGFFSDNVLAGLQRIAFRVFGTVDRAPASSGDE